LIFLDVIQQGIGRVFTDPDADKARAFFHKKHRALENKVMSVREAVEKFAHDGDYLVLGGFGANRIPTAVAHELVRQRRKNISLRLKQLWSTFRKP
jgi:glutaconate CoA-transferase subunit A